MLLPSTDDIWLYEKTIVYVSILGLHHDPIFFPRPLEFFPERFCENKYIESKVYIPFGLGPRKCFGRYLAMMIMKIFVANFLLEFHVEPPIEEKDFKKVQIDFDNVDVQKIAASIKLKITKRTHDSVPDPNQRMGTLAPKIEDGFKPYFFFCGSNTLKNHLNTGPGPFYFVPINEKNGQPGGANPNNEEHDKGIIYLKLVNVLYETLNKM